MTQLQAEATGSDQTGLAEPSREVIGRSPGELFWMRFRSDRVALGGLVFIVLLVLLALTAPLISRYVVHHGANELFREEMLNEFGLPNGPNGRFWFGADRAGRDLFVRVIYGARTSLVIALLATSFAVAVGVVLGMMAGYFRGWIDTAVSRSVDIILSMPLLLFAIGIVSTCSRAQEGCLWGTVKPGVPVVVFVIALFSWPNIARLVRGQTLSLRERDFIEASRVLGAGNASIMFREVLPNLVAPIIVYATLIIPTNIIFAASLSFLGLGVPDRVPEWGRMIAQAAPTFEIAWWFMFFPGLFLFLTTLAFNLVGDGLRDALDPRGSTKVRRAKARPSESVIPGEEGGGDRTPTTTPDRGGHLWIEDREGGP
jgi:ABC-type dipeptide/oligopeptide/nickel transport system permease subunit